MAFTNIIDIIYPVGSCYSSTVSTSPATLFGGTWNQIKGAVLAATGDNEFANGTYGGDLFMRRSQMPYHQHPIPIHGVGAVTTTAYGESWSEYNWDNQLYSGYKVFRDAAHTLGDPIWESDSSLSVDNFQVPADVMTTDFGKALCKTDSVLVGTFPRGAGQNFLPYHFGCYIWYRTA